MQQMQGSYSQSPGEGGGEVWMLCPYCGKRIRPQAIVCRFCGRDLIPPRPWYREPFWMVVWFLFLTPLWAALTITDTNRNVIIKLVAVMCLLCYTVVIMEAFGLIPSS